MARTAPHDAGYSRRSFLIKRDPVLVAFASSHDTAAARFALFQLQRDPVDVTLASSHDTAAARFALFQLLPFRTGHSNSEESKKWEGGE
jgi:hypothetical protein